MRPQGRWFSAVVLTHAAWWGLAGLAGLAGVEILLQYRVAIREAFARDTSRLGELTRAYAPFGTQHLHPNYLFFFPLRAADRVAIGNPTCSLDADGFREPGPAHANGRKLAFLLGGSAAFGYYASSNDTTITSYMNAMQNEYFFVNAGVPSWNSTQELFRVALEVAGRRPALVITYDGANDAAGASLAHPATGAPYPAGTPENFDELERVVDDPSGWGARLTLDGVLPEVMHRVRKYRHAIFAETPAPPIDPGRLDAAAARYLANLEQIAALSRAAGARYIAVFQPVAGLHRHLRASGAILAEARPGFHASVIKRRPSSFEFHDLSSVFDQYLSDIPMAGADVAPGTVFVDGVHLSDRGNEMVARHLLRLIAGPPARPAP
ncbi:MAG: SGNH/GDSL hydrolase family protein [Vicinamibacterales bacterium]